MEGPMLIFYIIVLIFSIIAHEVMHGIIAEKEGDPTARLMGRITLNPIKHIDIFGSIILPLILLLTHAGFMVGWAKPVPYNPSNVKGGRRSVAKIAASGPLTNLAIAILVGFTMRLMNYTSVLTASLKDIFMVIIGTNLALAFFNALPFAPLDGYTFLTSVIRFKPKTLAWMEKFSILFLLIFLVLGTRIFEIVLIKGLLLIVGTGPFVQ